MNPEAILALISDLYTQVSVLQAENARLTTALTETRQGGRQEEPQN